MNLSSLAVILRMEACVEKNDLSLGYMDSKGSIREFVLKQLEGLFPHELYLEQESLSAYTFSLMGDLPACPVMETREKIYSLLNIRPDSGKEKEIAEAIKDATLSQAADYARNNASYNLFRWRKCTQGIHLDCRPGGPSGILQLEARGLQLYLSDSAFMTEASGCFQLLLSPLRKALGDAAYSENVSIEIQSYGNNLF